MNILFTKSKISFLIACFLASAGVLNAQNINGQLDNPAELVTQYTVPVKMNDSIALMTDIYLPILLDDISFEVDLGFASGSVKIVKRGTQYIQYPGQADPAKLPLILSRTPYNKTNPTQGMVFALLGYAGAVQDMRGRYSSEGVYIPMYSDSWNKTPYHAFSSPLDITGTANTHQDGYQTVQWLANNLRFDSDNNGIITTTDRLVTNGNIGMFGASALANAQYQAAAAHKVNPLQPGLKSLMPIVGTGEFYRSTGFPNGVFRERIITGWLGGQLDDLDEGIPDGSLLNSIHTPADYNLSTKNQVKELAYNAWTTLQRAYYPNSLVRSDMDISRAPVNAAGGGQANGAFSRYINLNVPIYHLTGWWDIFTEGQIETWQNTINHIPAPNRHLQKLVIGPWTHQTIGSREAGDMQGVNRYKENVTDILKVDVSEISSSSTAFSGALLGVIESELLQWYRYTLGEPVAFLPENDWQYLDSANSPIQIRIPAQDFQVPFIDFVNFMNGGAGLNNVPVQIITDPSQNPVTTFYNIPATGQSAFGDTALTVFNYSQKEFNAEEPGGVAPARLYVTGPINDGIAANQTKGNYWLPVNTFPIPEIGLQPFYLHSGGILNQTAPASTEPVAGFTHNPDNPVATIGGGNMIVSVPGGGQPSQGQMNLANPLWKQQTMDSARVLHFESAAIPDSLSVIGFPEMKLYATSNPAGASAGEPTDTDFVVRVLDVYPDGREMYVTEGVVNARARAYAASVAAGNEDDNAAFTNINAGQTYEYHFRMLPLAHTWGQGHKLKILVSSSNYPRYQSNPNLPVMPDEFFRRKPNDGQTYTYNGTQMAPRIALNQVHFSASQPSAILLPVYNQVLSSTISEEAKPLTDFSIFPNPATGSVTLKTQIATKATYNVYNALGQLVLCGMHNGLSSPLMTTNLPPAAYYIQIKYQDEQKTISFIKL